MCILHDMVIKNGISLMNIKSTTNVTCLYHSMISGGISYVFVVTCPWVVHVVFPLHDPIFGSKMSSAFRMSCLVTRQLGIWFCLCN